MSSQASEWLPLNVSEFPASNRAYLPIRSPLLLTELQFRLLRIIEDWIDAHGWPPSLSELCVMYGTSTKSSLTNKHKTGPLDRLVEKGYISREPGTARAITVLIPSRCARVAAAKPKPLTKEQLCARCGRLVG